MVVSVKSSLGLQLPFVIGSLVAIILHPIIRATQYMEAACKLTTSLTLHPFAFRTHTHDLGRVVSGWKVRNFIHYHPVHTSLQGVFQYEVGANWEEGPPAASDVLSNPGKLESKSHRSMSFCFIGYFDPLIGL